MTKQIRNADPEVDALVGQLRQEIEQRKRVAPVSKVEYSGGPGVVGAELSRARTALKRASAKSDAARGWPRLLRWLRRDQNALNEALIDAIGALLKANDRQRERFDAAELRLEELERARTRDQ
ncbi:hypothetical protein BH20VER1_BH20VER1_18730 [soil metagenome]